MKKHHSILIANLFGLGLLMLSAIGEARNPTISSWIKNLSYTNILEPKGTYWSDEFSNLAVSGATVHALWYGRKDDWTDRRFVYRRSTNTGAGWDAERVIASQSDFSGSELSPDESATYLCASGETVHVVIPRSFSASADRNWYYVLEYYRSNDNGATFAPAEILVAGADVWRITQPRIACNTQRVVIGYKYAANWYSNYQINLLISDDAGATFRTSQVVSSNEKDGRFEDLALSGTDIYVLYYHLLEPYYYGNFQARIGLASSIDDGNSFRSQFLTTKATDGRYYALGTKDYHNGPDLAVVGSTVHVIWNQLNTNYQGPATLMYARSTNKGTTFERARGLLKNGSLYLGQETIAAHGNHVYVLFPTTDYKIKLRRSFDQGSSFRAVQDLSNEGGLRPQLGIDPRDVTGASVYAFWDEPTRRRSIDGGKTFTKPLWSHPIFSSTGLHRSQLVVGANGVIHTASIGGFSSNSLCNGGCDWDMHYRRILPASAPSGAVVGLRLLTDPAGSGGSDVRADNFQAAAQTINFTGAMTAEVWVKDMVGGIGTGYTDYRTPIFFKQRHLWEGYLPAYALGTVAYYDGKRKIVVDLETTQGFYSLSAPGDQGLLKPKTWTHLAMSYNAKQAVDNLKLYQNGVLIAKTTVAGNISSGFGNLFVGRFGNWVVDELRLWRRTLSQAEIKANMNRALRGNESGLSAYYNFNNTIRDMTGQGNDGLLMYKEAYTVGKF